MKMKIRYLSEILEDGQEIEKLMRGLEKDEEKLRNSKPDDDIESLKVAIWTKKQKIEKLAEEFTHLDLILLVMANFEQHKYLAKPFIAK